MAQVNPLTREVLIKLVYYGPGLGGKTTSLQKVHSASPPETRGKIVSLATPVDRTLYFDFMPLRVGPVHGYPVRLQLFTVPGQVYFNATRKLVLTNADGVVFVADSQRERQDANLESLQNLGANLAEQERSLSGVPHVLQYNKRDLSNVLAVAELDQALNQLKAPSFESSAARGLGVLEPLDELVRLVLLDLERRAVFGSDHEEAQAPRFEASQDGLRESVSRASEEWQEPSAEQALMGTKSLPPVQRSIPPRLSVAPRPQIVAASPAAIPASIPASIPAAIPTSIPAPARRQSLEPPRSPQFEASALAPSRGAGMSFGAAFVPEQAVRIHEIEQDLAQGDFRSAILRCDSLSAEILADAADLHGLDAEERKPALIALFLGLPAERWRVLRGLVRRANQGAQMAELEGLDVYATLLELNRLERRARHEAS